MPQIQVVNLKGQWGVYSWTQGFGSIKKELPLEHSALLLSSVLRSLVEFGAILRN